MTENENSIKVRVGDKVLQLGLHRISGSYPVIRLSSLFSRYPTFRPDSRWYPADNRIIFKIELTLLVVKHILENKNILDEFRSFTTSSFKIKGALAQMKSNIFLATVSLILIHWTVSKQPLYIPPRMIISQSKIGLFNTNKVRVIFHPYVLEFQYVACPELDVFFLLFWSNIQHVLGKISFGYVTYFFQFF